MRVLAADVGGTHTRVAVVDVDADPPSARVLAWNVAPTREEISPVDALVRLLGETGAAPEAVAVAVAGPVHDGVATLTNVEHRLEDVELAEATGIEETLVINDFEALGFALTVLREDDFAVIRPTAVRSTDSPPAPESRDVGGERRIALLGAGTGLGQATVRLRASLEDSAVDASEGGHVTFSPRSDLEWALRTYLAERFGHVSWERVLSGTGLHSIYCFLVAREPRREATATRRAIESGDPASAISERGLRGEDPLCVRSLELFASAYGARAGDVALAVGATGGIVLGGGIAPRILDALRGPAFSDGFLEKGRASEWLRDLSLRVVTQPRAGVMGAAAAGLRSTLRG